MRYAWKATSEARGWTDESSQTFATQRECYEDMMDHAVNKVKWNVEWEDVTEGLTLIEGKNGMTQTPEVGKNASYIGYQIKFMPHKIVHESYSGTYIYEIVAVEDETDEGRPFTVTLQLDCGINVNVRANDFEDAKAKASDKVDKIDTGDLEIIETHYVSAEDETGNGKNFY